MVQVRVRLMERWFRFLHMLTSKERLHVNVIADSELCAKHGCIFHNLICLCFSETVSLCSLAGCPELAMYISRRLRAHTDLPASDFSAGIKDVSVCLSLCHLFSYKTGTIFILALQAMYTQQKH